MDEIQGKEVCHLKENPCKEYLVLMQALLDGVATPSDEAKWQEHIASCESCKALYRELKDLKQAMSSIVAEPPHGLDDAILKDIHTADKEKKLHSINRRLHLTRTFAGVAAAFAILLVGGWALSHYGLKSDLAKNDAAPMEISLEEETSIYETFESTLEQDPGIDMISDSEMSNSSSAPSSGGLPGMLDGNARTDRESILDALETAISELILPGTYKNCVYLDCNNLPEGRSNYQVDPLTDTPPVTSPSAPKLTFYSTGDYLGFINGAGLELNFSLDLTESEMQACGIAIGGNLTLVAIATQE